MKRRTFFNLSAAAGLGMILPRSVSNASEINPEVIAINQRWKNQ